MALKSLYKGRRTPTNDELAVQAQTLVDAIGLPGVSPVTDADKTVTYKASKRLQRLNVPITADRTVTLSTSGAVEGAEFRFFRTAAATGSFNWNIGAGSALKALAAGQGCSVVFDGTTWVLAS